MTFVFQKIHKDPKHLQFCTICRRFSHDCCMFKQQYKLLVLSCCSSFTQDYVLVRIFAFTAIYTQSVFALYFLVPILACASHCIYFVVICTFAFVSQSFTLPFVAFSILHRSTVFEVIRFSVPLNSHILYLAFVSSHFFQIFSVILSFVQHRMGCQLNVIGKCIKHIRQSLNFILSFIFAYLKHVVLIAAICYC